MGIGSHSAVAAGGLASSDRADAAVCDGERAKRDERGGGAGEREWVVPAKPEQA